MSYRPIDVIGKKYGTLTVMIQVANGTQNTSSKYECLCSCGETVVMTKRRILDQRSWVCCGNKACRESNPCSETRYVSRRPVASGFSNKEEQPHADTVRNNRIRLELDADFMSRLGGSSEK